MVTVRDKVLKVFMRLIIINKTIKMNFLLSFTQVSWTHSSINLILFLKKEFHELSVFEILINFYSLHNQFNRKQEI
jgi:hypothetical protein